MKHKKWQIDFTINLYTHKAIDQETFDVIRNNYSKDKSLQENINTSEQLISIKEQYSSLLKENNTLNLKNKYYGF